MLQRVYLNHHTILLDVVTWRGLYDNYLAISEFILLLNVVGIDAWLGEQCGFLGKVGYFWTSDTILINSSSDGKSRGNGKSSRGTPPLQQYLRLFGWGFVSGCIIFQDVKGRHLEWEGMHQQAECGLARADEADSEHVTPQVHSLNFDFYAVRSRLIIP